MKIAALDPSLLRPVGQSVAQRMDRHGPSPHAITNDDGQTKKTASVPPVADVSKTPIEPSEPNESESRGVMRLLAANHFRGVADVRLRINFYDDLSAASASAANAAAESESQVFLDGVNSALDEFLASLSLDDETMEAIGDRIASFEDDVRAALGSHVTESSVDADALGDALRSVFEDLAAEISLLMNPPTDDVVPDPVVDSEEPPPDGVVGVPDDSSQPGPDVGNLQTTASPDGVDSADSANAVVSTAVESPEASSVVDTTVVEQDETEPPADSSLTVLIEAFEGFLNDYLSSIASASQLADPAPYDGNGSAYGKFLAIYNDLRGVSSTVDEQV
ncbi:MAG: hypothetical protein IH897_07480 [Planctomycetes bacterium]|nr:hypothetical protein [Planctomycetota bacterium]